MIFRPKSLLMAMLTALAAPAFAAYPGDATSPCLKQSFESSGYIVCAVKPGEVDLRLFWKNGEGKPYRSFSTLSDVLRAGGKNLIFAMNAGMYSDDFIPVGLYVEDGRELVPANRRVVTGKPGEIPNFYKQPNGVFFLDGAGGHILTTGDYLEQQSKSGREEPRFATQSGPMLVINNKLNPALIEGSSDRTRRSAVGACEDGALRFVISEDDVNFHDLARFFRDELKCSNALFLDGGHGTGLFDPALKRADWSWHGGYGPMIGLVE
ncbi:phosphodiester glycosidase family protein [Neorhizobium sp. NCHU2750]|uniref:phosphodiester glycosidase family protein n=1 Tax=Neorhizobium sp. NCHU2750 TaxID=1825976 RepID=UPI000E759A09|nr:hypothetical protein NCHU2750_48210 [Neorhizobium sp. NCHU2750]